MTFLGRRIPARGCGLLAALAAIAFTPFGLRADDVHAVSIVPPKLLSAPDLLFPIEAREQGIEGLVTVEFTVLKDGTAASPHVLGDFQTELYSERLLSTLKDFKYQPATVDGQPSDYYLIQTFELHLLDMPVTETAWFKSGYDNAEEMIGNKDYAGAENYIKTEVVRRAKRIYEYGLYESALARIDYSEGKVDEALSRAHKLTTRLEGPRMLKLAETQTGSRLPTMPMMRFYGALDEANYLDILRLEFSADGDLSRIEEALRVYDKINSIQPVKDTDPLAQLAPRMRDYVTQPVIVARATLLGDAALSAITAGKSDGSWSYEPERRTWKFAKVNGRIDEIDVRCEVKSVSLPFADVSFTAPDAWGKCSVGVLGQAGTTFLFVEAK
jgi:TonB family protein